MIGGVNIKSTFLQVMGILSVIFGGIGTITGLSNIASYTGLGMVLYGFVELASSVLLLTEGIMGVMYCANRDKASICVFIGIITVLVKVLAIIVYNNSPLGRINTQAMASIGASGLNIAIMAVALIDPVLYFIAALRFARKKAA